MGLLITIVLILGALLLGAGISWFVHERLLRQRVASIVQEAERSSEMIVGEAKREQEVIKQKKLLEVKEKFIQYESNLKKEVAEKDNLFKQR